MALSTEQFAKTIIAAGLLSADEIKTVWQSLPANLRPKNGREFANVLIRKQKLTAFQADEMLVGSGLPLVLGEYALLSKVGAGGMGEVFKAHHRRMKRTVALKLLPTVLAQDEEAVRRFQREVEAAAKLVHPNIVQAYDAGEQGGHWYLVMEYVDGCDLSELVAKVGPLPVKRALDYICQTARGLAFAHQNGIIHRDIKPANLLVNKEGVLKILDMGLARIDDCLITQDGLTQSGVVMGTIDYMSPEQAFDTHTVDARADVYSLGCTLFRLLTGQNVFGGRTLVQKLLAHREQLVPELPELRPDIPVQLNAIFQKMVAKRPEDRFQTMSEVEAALATFQTDGLENSFSDGAVMGSAGNTWPTGSFPQLPALSINSTPSSAVAPNSIASTETTVSLANPLQVTDPLSERSVHVALELSRESLGRNATVSLRRRQVLLVAAVTTVILLAAGLLTYFLQQPPTASGNIAVSREGAYTAEEVVRAYIENQAQAAEYFEREEVEISGVFVKMVKVLRYLDDEIDVLKPRNEDQENYSVAPPPPDLNRPLKAPPAPEKDQEAPPAPPAAQSAIRLPVHSHNNRPIIRVVSLSQYSEGQNGSETESYHLLLTPDGSDPENVALTFIFDSQHRGKLAALVPGQQICIRGKYKEALRAGDFQEIFFDNCALVE